jgi:LAO/AO transport system kinase
VVLLVLNPGAGDEIQALKAGVMEIGDIYVINKADYPGVASLERDLREVCDNTTRSMVPPVVVRTVASAGEGLDELYGRISTHYDALGEAGELARRHRERLADAVADTAADMVRAWAKERFGTAAAGDVSLVELRRRLADALETISTDFGGSHDGDD